MKSAARLPSHATGATLAEAVITLGILAVAIPLVFGALATAGRSSAESDTACRSNVILHECLTTIDRLRHGSTTWFESVDSHTPFPPSGETWALAFREDGHVIDRISPDEYANGTREVNGQSVRFITTMQAVAADGASPTPGPLQLTITIEQPAALPAERRKAKSFLSLLQ